MQEPALGNPAPFLNDDAVHDGDLPSRTAKAQQRHLDPDAQSFREADTMGDGFTLDGPG